MTAGSAAVTGRWAVSRVGTGVAALMASAALLKFAPAPFVWISLVGVTVFTLLVATGRATWIRLTCLLAAAILFALGASEAALWVWGKPEIVLLQRPATFYDPDSVLGWRLKPAIVVHAVEHVGDRLVFDARYTIDASGHRVSPSTAGGVNEACVLFFADSFTFGHGLDDSETVAYRVGRRLAGRFRVINFGTPAYGAEHMLAELERGIVQRDATCRPTHIVYQAMPHHVLRAAGKVGFARYSPRYALGVTNALRYEGTTPRRYEFVRSGAIQVQRVDEQLRKSRLYTTLRNREPASTPADVRLYLTIVQRSHDLIQALYPGSEFHVLLWMHEHRATEGNLLRTGLLAVTPNVHVVDDVLPGYRTRPSQYELDPHDGHPNARANTLLADFVVDRIVLPSREGEAP